MKKKKADEKLNKGEIIIYQSKSGPSLNVRLEQETVWLTQKQMSDLFKKDVRTINEHIKNIYKEGEVKGGATIRKFRIVQKEGGRMVERSVDFYDLNVIISVGYRVKSLRGTQFRIWATRKLKDHLIQGYTINEQRLAQKLDQLNKLQKTIAFLQEKARHELLDGRALEILDLLSDYSKSLTLLEQYDKKKIKLVRGKSAKFVLSYEHSLELIVKIKKEILSKKQAGDLFGQEISHKLESIIKNLSQTFGGKALYPSIEEKAANLLYLIIKDHPFADGNKRIASFLFIYFLDRSRYLYKKNGERKINDNALVSLALLIAISEPKEKDMMIRLITNLLTN